MIAVDNLKLEIKPGVSSVLRELSNFLAEQGIKSYLVGGFVRDALLDRETNDIDIALSGDALETAAKVAAITGGKFVPLDEANKVGRVILAASEAGPAVGLEIDFSTLKGDIENDLAQRDFTIDAIALDIDELARGYTRFHLIDPFEGMADLQHGIVRAVSEAALKSDAARLLRAVRLAAELKFTIDEGTEALIQRDCHLILGIAGERVHEELLRLLAVPHAEHLVPYLDELGLVTAIIPELSQAKGATQPKEHFWDVFTHSVNTVAAADFLLRKGSWSVGKDSGRRRTAGEVLASVPWSSALAGHFEQAVGHGSTRRVLLKLAVLLHDVAKPQTKTIDADGRMRFFEHATEGAKIVAGIMERLRFSTREIKLVETMVKYHLRPTQMSPSGLPTRRAIYRYFRDTGEAGIDILFLSLADHLATRGPLLDLAEWQQHTEIVAYVLTQREERETVVAPPRLVDGHDLMRIFGLKPGPGIGELLESVREAQAAGELSTREEALAYLRNRIIK